MNLTEITGEINVIIVKYYLGFQKNGVLSSECINDHVPVHPSFDSVKEVNIVTHMSIFRQQLGRNIPEIRSQQQDIHR
jgi:hypothetical protein